MLSKWDAATGDCVRSKYAEGSRSKRCTAQVEPAARTGRIHGAARTRRPSASPRLPTLYLFSAARALLLSWVENRPRASRCSRRRRLRVTQRSDTHDSDRSRRLLLKCGMLLEEGWESPMSGRSLFHLQPQSAFCTRLLDPDRRIHRTLPSHVGIDSS